MCQYRQLGRYVPGDPADPHGDRATLRQLQELGADLTKPTHFIHFIAFPNREHARTGGREIAEQLGYRVEGTAPEDPGDEWLVSAEREQIPTLENISRMRQALTLVAERSGGDYDGWEAAVAR